ncbi:hypothetical protein GLAREA_10047 [Glarea lozoyensis ATCC 20868]|uniref:Heterokaryon incompatibility domain-containing protein n=1 Tax=Glarea lozoyensis (strain ATCC 20868 / MF5171) TaxID=1116229 RepID=S3E7Q5_GLAL2|nr:uncharacterized protein GLAREA_10047 [Glarea lozoyensis ATCC 20868]EPE34353.1 hypothetical protein GLAREA_10047 [Glarea lozoyensis ATCC 20868]
MITVDINTIGDINSTNTLLDAEGYTALSYGWGSAQPSYEVFIAAQNDANEFSLLVQQQVHEFLSHFRSPIKAQYLWIDSICISQGDKSERQIQIQDMHQIYSECRIVAVWLGAESNKEEVKIFQELASSSNHDVSRQTLTRMPPDARTIVHESSFQEILIAPRVQLCMGNQRMTFDFKQTLPHLGLQESNILTSTGSKARDTFPDASSVGSIYVAASGDSRSIFSDESRETFSTHTSTIGHSKELVLSELVHFFALDKELVNTYRLLTGPEAFGPLQQMIRNLLKHFALELLVELETVLKDIPSFILEQRHRLSRRVCELLQPHHASISQDFLEQDVDKNDILNSYFRSMLDARESKNRFVEYISSDSSDSEMEEFPKSNLTKRIKDRLLRTQAMKKLSKRS